VHQCVLHSSITFTPHVALSVCVREIGHSLANKLEMRIEPKPNWTFRTRILYSAKPNRTEPYSGECSNYMLMSNCRLQLFMNFIVSVFVRMCVVGRPTNQCTTQTEHRPIWGTFCAPKIINNGHWSNEPNRTWTPNRVRFPVSKMNDSCGMCLERHYRLFMAYMTLATYRYKFWRVKKKSQTTS